MEQLITCHLTSSYQIFYDRHDARCFKLRLDDGFLKLGMDYCFLLEADVGEFEIFV